MRENFVRLKDSVKHMRISFNSPVILVFVGICSLVLLIDMVTQSALSDSVCSIYRSTWKDPLFYIRMVCHIFGHIDWSHFIGNMTLILLLGPLLEEKYGKIKLIFIIFTTAIVTGFLHILFSKDTALLGASGVVFAFIVISSMTGMKGNKIPLTFLLIVMIYIGEEIYQIFFVMDDVSNLTHIVGGMVGAFFGYLLQDRKK